jgi:hypothetical protein
VTYTVVWSVFALQAVTRLEQSFDTDSVRKATDWIDYVLRRSPHERGESRNPGFRVWYEDVLGVFYRIDDAARRVEILFAGPTRRR